MTCALRSFLRYVRYRGKAKLDLAAAVPGELSARLRSVPFA
jgi:hypothetical protein